MHVSREDIQLIRSHLDVVGREPLSLIQEGALDSVLEDLVDADSLLKNIESIKVHLEIVRKYPLPAQQEQALGLAIEVANKISVAAKRWSSSGRVGFV